MIRHHVARWRSKGLRWLASSFFFFFFATNIRVPFVRSSDRVSSTSCWPLSTGSTNNRRWNCSTASDWSKTLVLRTTSFRTLRPLGQLATTKPPAWTRWSSTGWWTFSNPAVSSSNYSTTNPDKWPTVSWNIINIILRSLRSLCSSVESHAFIFHSFI